MTTLLKQSRGYLVVEAIIVLGASILGLHYGMHVPWLQSLMGGILIIVLVAIAVMMHGVAGPKHRVVRRIVACPVCFARSVLKQSDLQDGWERYQCGSCGSVFDAEP